MHASRYEQAAMPDKTNLALFAYSL